MKKRFIEYYFDWRECFFQNHEEDALIVLPELWITFKWEQDNGLTLFDANGNWSRKYLQELHQLEITDPSLWLVISTMHARLLSGYYSDASVRSKQTMQELSLTLDDLFADAEAFYIHQKAS